MSRPKARRRAPRKRAAHKPAARGDRGGGATPNADLSSKDYEKALKKLHVELVKLQLWVAHTGAKVCIVFEGRDGAGKGGTIKAITERVSPRVFRVIALPAPTEREKSQMYVQRYLPHLPAAGEVVIFDRSWYNRAGVERVMGFATDEQVKRFLKGTPPVEKAIVDSGVILLKYWLEVSPEEQTRRLKSRFEDGRKIWKLSPMDLKSYSRWYDYSRARDDMFHGHRHQLRALASGSLEPQEDGPAEHHQRHPEEHSLQGAAAREAQAAGAAEARRLRRAGLSVQGHRPGLLSTRWPATPIRPRPASLGRDSSCATAARCICAPSRRPTRQSSCRRSSG